MASLGSSIRSAARATSPRIGAFRSAGVSPADPRLLTFVILAGFASVVDVVTDNQISSKFVAAIQDDTATLQLGLHPVLTSDPVTLDCTAHIHLYDFARADHAQIAGFRRRPPTPLTQDSGAFVASPALPVFGDHIALVSPRKTATGRRRADVLEGRARLAVVRASALKRR